MAVVLIVEDEEQVRVLAEAIIQELGHETLTAGTAEQALALVQERPDVDLLFTDIGLQHDLEAGLQLAKGIAAQKPGLPVLYTTGQGVTAAPGAGTNNRIVGWAVISGVIGDIIPVMIGPGSVQG